MNLKDHLPELAGACYCIAAANEGVSKVEVQTISENIALFAERKVTSAEVAKLLLHARADIEVQGRSGYLKLLASRISEAEARSQLLGAAASVMLADREASWDERKVFLAMADALGLTEHEAKFILRSVGAPLSDAQTGSQPKTTLE